MFALLASRLPPYKWTPHLVQEALKKVAKTLDDDRRNLFLLSENGNGVSAELIKRDILSCLGRDDHGRLMLDDLDKYYDGNDIERIINADVEFLKQNQLEILDHRTLIGPKYIDTFRRNVLDLLEDKGSLTVVALSEMCEVPVWFVRRELPFAREHLCQNRDLIYANTFLHRQAALMEYRLLMQKTAPCSIDELFGGVMDRFVIDECLRLLSGSSELSQNGQVRLARRIWLPEYYLANAEEELRMNWERVGYCSFEDASKRLYLNKQHVIEKLQAISPDCLILDSGALQRCFYDFLRKRVEETEAVKSWLSIKELLDDACSSSDRQYIIKELREHGSCSSASEYLVELDILVATGFWEHIFESCLRPKLQELVKERAHSNADSSMLLDDKDVVLILASSNELRQRHDLVSFVAKKMSGRCQIFFKKAMDDASARNLQSVIFELERRWALFLTYSRGIGHIKDNSLRRKLSKHLLKNLGFQFYQEVLVYTATGDCSGSAEIRDMAVWLHKLSPGLQKSFLKAAELSQADNVSEYIQAIQPILEIIGASSDRCEELVPRLTEEKLLALCEENAAASSAVLKFAKRFHSLIYLNSQKFDNALSTYLAIED